MKTIHKYQLAYGDNTILMPKGAVIRHVGDQAFVATIWVEVDTEQPLERRYFVIIGTGKPIPEDDGYLTSKYHGTFFQGSFVWHIYEQIPTEE